MPCAFLAALKPRAVDLRRARLICEVPERAISGRCPRVPLPKISDVAVFGLTVACSGKMDQSYIFKSDVQGSLFCRV